MTSTIPSFPPSFFSFSFSFFSGLISCGRLKLGAEIIIDLTNLWKEEREEGWKRGRRNGSKLVILSTGEQPAEFLGGQNFSRPQCSTRKPVITIGVTVVPSCPIVGTIPPRRVIRSREINSIAIKIWAGLIIIWEMCNVFFFHARIIIRSENLVERAPRLVLSFDSGQPFGRYKWTVEIFRDNRDACATRVSLLTRENLSVIPFGGCIIILTENIYIFIHAVT